MNSYMVSYASLIGGNLGLHDRTVKHDGPLTPEFIEEFRVAQRCWHNAESVVILAITKLETP